MKKALLAVSFGTTVPEGQKSIDAVERTLMQQAPEYRFCRAFTSPTIRRVLAARGEVIPDLAQALEQLERDGVEEVAVQPTHLLYGCEYDGIRETVRTYSEAFRRLALGVPLLADTHDLKGLAEALAREYPRPEQALVLLGHGTPHFANAVYPALQTVFRLRGDRRVYVGTIEGWPGFDEVLAQLREDGCRDILLAPLMLVAGDHAVHDMAGQEPDSWKSRLEQAGCSVTCAMTGLGLLPAVQQMYAGHVRQIL